MPLSIIEEASLAFNQRKLRIFVNANNNVAIMLDDPECTLFEITTDEWDELVRMIKKQLKNG